MFLLTVPYVSSQYKMVIVMLVLYYICKIIRNVKIEIHNIIITLI